jgi:hypothetical protein
MHARLGVPVVWRVTGDGRRAAADFGVCPVPDIKSLDTGQIIKRTPDDKMARGRSQASLGSRGVDQTRLTRSKVVWSTLCELDIDCPH